MGVWANGPSSAEIDGVAGLRLDGLWLRSPLYGFGGAVTVLGTYPFDAYYGADGMLQSGLHALVFVEGDLSDGWFTPYARFGVGLGSYLRVDRQGTGSEALDAVAEFEGGLALRGGPFVLRLSAAPSFYGRDLFVVFGLQLGARF